ncbi:AEC family transporter [Pasteurellaceae bacterium 20609_3]|uniref:AEC family transporter n=1 Tax=Spirabiliibacterium mucosae TaxID=28156 RepID=UPI001AAD3244|nr:AEC family transporter [Spirabiliibacterium mucosae]MBE2898605.1 AEC family transporter [Spirabiliibacterium mucosae]
MQDTFLDSIAFSVSVTLPNILMLLLGIYLKRIGMINDHFAQQGAKLVFNITLPALLFLSIVQNPTDYSSQLSIVGVGYLGTLIIFTLAELYAWRFVGDKRERGTFVQGVFRGNSGIIGLSLCANAYGAAGIAVASVYTALITLLYNVLAVITLSRSLAENGKADILYVLKQLIKNPLILAIIIALVVSHLPFTIPAPLISTGNYLSHMTLPLALLCAGASLDLKRIDSTSVVAITSSLGRVFVAPIIMVLLAHAFGLHGIGLGVVFLMTSTPVAAASYAMVRGMGGNDKTAANIIGITTFAAMFTSAFGIVILKMLDWI